jgi:hypothetical protein
MKKKLIFFNALSNTYSKNVAPVLWLGFPQRSIKPIPKGF